jgi:hypothetical protein
MIRVSTSPENTVSTVSIVSGTFVLMLANPQHALSGLAAAPLSRGPHSNIIVIAPKSAERRSM